MHRKISGTALAVMLFLATGASAAPGGEPGKPDSKPNSPEGPAGNPGSDRAQEVRSDAEPNKPESKPAPIKQNAKPKTKPKQKPKPKVPPKPKSKPDADDAPAPKVKAGKTTICHSTGSETNPYVLITVSDNALKAHARHHDGRDIIPAPAGGCPGPETGGTAPAAADGQGSDAAGAHSGGEGSVLGAEESSAPADADPASQAVAAETDDGGSLPFTGLALLGLLGVAVLALGGGFTARRAS